MSFSPAALRALKIVSDNPGIVAAHFARKMWPDSPAWKRRGRGGPNRAGALGAAVWRRAGSYLYWLQDAGLVYHHTNEVIQCEWHITGLGRQCAEDVAIFHGNPLDAIGNSGGEV